MSTKGNMLRPAACGVLTCLIVMHLAQLSCGNSSKARGSAQPTQLTITASTEGKVASGESATLRIQVRNVSDKQLCLDGRLVLGHHVDLSIVSDTGKAERLGYPSVALVLPQRKDFVRINAGQSLDKAIPIDNRMLPTSVKQDGTYLVMVRVAIIDSGKRFGLSGWTGVLKSYAPLRIRVK